MTRSNLGRKELVQLPFLTKTCRQRPWRNYYSLTALQAARSCLLFSFFFLEIRSHCVALVFLELRDLFVSAF